MEISKFSKTQSQCPLIQKFENTVLVSLKTDIFYYDDARVECTKIGDTKQKGWTCVYKPFNQYVILFLCAATSQNKMRVDRGCLTNKYGLKVWNNNQILH